MTLDDAISIAPPPARSAPPVEQPAQRPSPAEQKTQSWRLPAVQGYVLASFLTVVAYLTIWLSHFPYVYGWIMDDRTDFIKGMDTVHDWRAAFAYYDALQPYFYLISYLPLASGLSLPSYPLPGFGEHTGQFRFFLLCALFLHAVLLAIWAWFAARVTRSRAAAALSVAILATSPTYTLWSPQPESRLLGLPFALPALWLLLRSDGLSGARRAVFGWTFLAGSLFGIAQSIHYTALYLIVPVSLAIWGSRLLRGWRRGRYWLGLLGFVLGCVWLQALVEFVSDFIVGIPWQSGPTMTLLELRQIHTSSWTVVGNLQLWQEWFTSQFGIPLIIGVVVGWVLFLRQMPGTGAQTRHAHVALGVGLLLGVAYLGLSGSMALFRQTSVLQPFLFLFASVAVVEIGRWVSRQRLATHLACSGALLLVVGFIPWTQAFAVFKGHEGIGRALEWVYSNHGDRPIEWLRIAWYGDATSLTTKAQLDGAPAGAWLVTYFPYQFVNDRPSLLPAMQETRPLAAWPTLWTTDTIHAEMEAYWPNFDMRFDSVMNEVRVYALQDILRELEGAPLDVASVTGDSALSPETEPLNVFDHDSAPDGHTAWASKDTPMPHWIDIQFKRPTLLGDVRIVEPPNADRSVAHISSLEVQITDGQGTYRSVWESAGLDRLPVIAPHWDPALISGIKIVIRGEAVPWGTVNQAAIEEITFPGFTVRAPAGSRAFPQLGLKSLAVTSGGVLIQAEGITPQTVLMVDGKTVPIRATGVTRQFVAALDDITSGEARRAYLTDGERVSQEVTISTQPPRLRAVSPRAASVGVPFVVQPDGSSALSIDCDGAAPDSQVLFDGVALGTTFGNEHWLTATLPKELLSVAGHHTIRLRDVFGESNTVGFEVTP